MAQTWLPPEPGGPSGPMTSAKGHRHEQMWMPGLAQLDPQTADRAKTVHWPGQKGTQHGSWQGLSWPCEKTCQVSGMPGAAPSLRTATHGGMPCTTGPWSEAPTALCRGTHVLKQTPLSRRCRYFYILYGTLRTQNLCIFGICIDSVDTGRLWEDLSLFFM